MGAPPWDRPQGCRAAPSTAWPLRWPAYCPAPTVPRSGTARHARWCGTRAPHRWQPEDLIRADIIERLQLKDARLFICSFYRPNIRFRIEEKKDATTQLLRFIEREHADKAGVVYCQSRKRVEELAATLCDSGPQKVMLDSDHSFDTMYLTEGSRAVLRGEVPVQLRESVSSAPAKRSRKSSAPPAAPPTWGPTRR